MKGTIPYKSGLPEEILPYNARHTMGYSSGGYLIFLLSETTEWHGDS